MDMKAKIHRKLRVTTRKAFKMSEAAAVYGSPRQVNVRAAKNQLSGLLDMATRGEDVIITSHGVPKARLTSHRPKLKRFKVNWQLLHSMPAQRTGKRSEEIIREDRDGRP